jgi:hypothetical protein
MPFNGDYAARKLGQHGRLVAAARADLEHALSAGEFEGLGHQCHHIRLADGLTAADR